MLPHPTHLAQVIQNTLEEWAREGILERKWDEFRQACERMGITPPERCE